MIMTMMMMATAAVELLLGDEQLDPNKTNHFGMSPLLEAAHRRQFHALRLLLADRRDGAIVVRAVLAQRAGRLLLERRGHAHPK